MLVVGSIIGAGFASGKELITFFGNHISIWIALACGLGYFIFNMIFLYIGSIVKKNNVGEANKVIMGKFHFIADFFLLLNSLIVLSGMLAGMDSLFSIYLPISPAFSVISGIICALITVRGIGGLMKVNDMIVPIIIVVIFSIGIINVDFPISFEGEFRTYSLFIYIGMNLMLSSGFFITLHNTDKKTVFFSSLISAIILTLLMVLLISALNRYGDPSSDMPMLSLCSQSKVLNIFAVIAIAVSIFTTMLTAMSTLYNWVNSYFKSAFCSAFVTLAAGLAVSNIGFSNVLTYLYPIIGVAGLIYMIACVIFVLRSAKSSALFVNMLFNKRNGKIHKRGKNT